MRGSIVGAALLIAQVAGFVDYGKLARELAPDRGVAAVGRRSESLLSPGLGLRVLTGLGPIRIDVAYDGTGDRRYPLFTESDTGALTYLGDVVYNPFEHGKASALDEFWRRFQVQIAIGQAF